MISYKYDHLYLRCAVVIQHIRIKLSLTDRRVGCRCGEETTLLIESEAQIL